MISFLCFFAAAIDGDTLRCSSGARVRLWGVDTPEQGERGYSEATGALASKLGTVLICQSRGKSYNRTVAICRTPSGIDIGRAQLREGHAVEWCRYSRGYYGGCR
jgi:micrococcal nuclease